MDAVAPAGPAPTIVMLFFNGSVLFDTTILSINY